MAHGGGGEGGKADHFGTWAVSIAVASVALWGHWLVYTRVGLRWMLPNTILTSERLIFAGWGIALLVGALITVYQARLLVRGGESTNDWPHHAR